MLELLLQERESLVERREWTTSPPSTAVRLHRNLSTRFARRNGGGANLRTLQARFPKGGLGLPRA